MDKVLNAEEFQKLAKKFDLSIRLRSKAERFAKYCETNGYGHVPAEVVHEVSIPDPVPQPKKKRPPKKMTEAEQTKRAEQDHQAINPDVEKKS